MCIRDRSLMMLISSRAARASASRESARIASDFTEERMLRSYERLISQLHGGN